MTSPICISYYCVRNYKSVLSILTFSLENHQNPQNQQQVEEHFTLSLDLPSSFYTSATATTTIDGRNGEEKKEKNNTNQEDDGGLENEEEEEMFVCDDASAEWEDTFLIDDDSTATSTLSLPTNFAEDVEVIVSDLKFDFVLSQLSSTQQTEVTYDHKDMVEEERIENEKKKIEEKARREKEEKEREKREEQKRIEERDRLEKERLEREDQERREQDNEENKRRKREEREKKEQAEQEEKERKKKEQEEQRQQQERQRNEREESSIKEKEEREKKEKEEEERRSQEKAENEMRKREKEREIEKEERKRESLRKDESSSTSGSRDSIGRERKNSTKYSSRELKEPINEERSEKGEKVTSALPTVSKLKEAPIGGEKKEGRGSSKRAHRSSSHSPADKPLRQQPTDKLDSAPVHVLLPASSFTSPPKPASNAVPPVASSSGANGPLPLPPPKPHRAASPATLNNNPSIPSSSNAAPAPPPKARDSSSPNMNSRRRASRSKSRERRTKNLTGEDTSSSEENHSKAIVKKMSVGETADTLNVIPTVKTEQRRQVQRRHTSNDGRSRVRKNSSGRERGTNGGIRYANTEVSSPQVHEIELSDYRTEETSRSPGALIHTTQPQKAPPPVPLKPRKPRADSPPNNPTDSHRVHVTPRERRDGNVVPKSTSIPQLREQRENKKSEVLERLSELKQSIRA